MLVCRFPIEAPQNVAQMVRASGKSAAAEDTEGRGFEPHQSADASPLNEYSNSHHGLPEEEGEEGTDDDAYNDPRTGQARDINRGRP